MSDKASLNRLQSIIEENKKSKPKIEEGKVGALRRLTAQNYEQYGPGYNALAQADSIEAGLKTKEPVIPPDQLWSQHATINRYNSLMRKRAKSELSPDEEAEYQNLKTEMNTKEPVDEADRYTKKIIEIDKSIGATKDVYDKFDKRKSVPLLSDPTRKDLGGERKKYAEGLFYVNLSKTLEERTGKKFTSSDAEKHLMSAVNEWNTVKKILVSGENREEAKQNIARKYGFNDFEELQKAVKQVREYAR